MLICIVVITDFLNVWPVLIDSLLWVEMPALANLLLYLYILYNDIPLSYPTDLWVDFLSGHFLWSLSVFTSLSHIMSLVNVKFNAWYLVWGQAWCHAQFNARYLARCQTWYQLQCHVSWHFWCLILLHQNSGNLNCENMEQKDRQRPYVELLRNEKNRTTYSSVKESFNLS